MPDNLRSRLLERAISIGEVLPPGDAAMSADKAITAARGLPGVQDQAPEVFLVSFTDSKMGTAKSEEEGEITPEYVNRVAWLIVFPDTIQPIIGPYRGGESSGPSIYVADLAVFVDATTGEFLEALTL